jgi:hypothetical protein
MFLRPVQSFLFLIVVPLHAAAQLPVEAQQLAIVATAKTVRAAGAPHDPAVVAGKDYSLRRAYDDVFKILAAENICSDFYGGPAVATTVLNQFISKVARGQLPGFISFQMTGRPRTLIDLPSGASYRLFDKAVVNNEGAFYQRRNDPLQSRPRNVGSFPTGTRSAQALILMHELAHLIKDRNGAWLIADDGQDSRQSTQNTLQIEKRCGAQLRGLN